MEAAAPAACLPGEFQTPAEGLQYGPEVWEDGSLTR